jgi:hypothetical protein
MGTGMFQHRVHFISSLTSFLKFLKKAIFALLT